MTDLASDDIQLIQAILPHRYPFLLVERVDDAYLASIPATEPAAEN